MKSAVPVDLAGSLDTSERDVRSSGQGMRIAAVYSCVKLLSDGVAALPLSIDRRRDGIFEPEDSWLSYLLSVQPNEDMSAFDFWSQAVQYMTLHGNAYIVPVNNPMTGEIERFLLPHPSCVAYDDIRSAYYVNDVRSGFCDTLLAPGIIHLRNTSHDGLRGIGIIAWARMALSIAATGDEETRQRFANGGNVRGIVSTDNTGVPVDFGAHADKEKEKVARRTDLAFRGCQRVISMPERVKFDPISNTSTDMQFLETRKFSVLEICRFFRVPPSFIFADTSNNYKSAENALLDFRQNALNPLLCRIEGELTRKLFTPSETRRRRIRFDRSALSACDADAQMKYATARIQAGIDTVNEARLAQNKRPVEGGDTPLVSANLKTIKQLMAESAAKTDNKDNNGKENSEVSA